jgi:hypothetical protein
MVLQGKVDDDLPTLYTLTVNQYALWDDHTSIFFSQEGEYLTLRGINLDEGSIWYFCDLNDLFDGGAHGKFPTFGNIQMNGVPLMGSTLQSDFVGYRDFYLGVNTAPGRCSHTLVTTLLVGRI